MKPNPSMDRRSFLRRVGLVAAATGLPPQFLLKPSIANAGALDAQATFLLLSVSSDGDPLNANLPGSYVPDAMNNPLLPATEVSVGSQRWLAGSPWADASLDRFRSRTCFFHHVCHTAAHTEMAAVLGLHGAIASSNGRGFEQLPSMIAQENAASLGTLQQEPIALGPERLTFGSRPLPSIRPQEVAALFLGSPAGGQAASLESLAELRDAAINDLYRREDFGAPQRAFLDRYAQKPIYVFGGFGLLNFAVSLAAGLWAVYLKYGAGISFIQTPLPLLVVMSAITGVICVLLGLVAEMVTRNWHESHDKRTYIVGATRYLESGSISAGAD